MPKEQPAAIIIVGINGAGKTTFYHTVIKPTFKGAYLNADEWQQRTFPGEMGKHNREAALWIEQQRNAKIESGESFVTESVFFGDRHNIARKAREAGYQVELIHIHIESSKLARNRVEYRVARGGHDVSERLIVQRFKNVDACVKRAVAFADRVDVFENSREASSPCHLVTTTGGRAVMVARDIPDAIARLYEPQITAFITSS